jgi:hypothetical protein
MAYLDRRDVGNLLLEHGSMSGLMRHPTEKSRVIFLTIDAHRADAFALYPGMLFSHQPVPSVKVKTFVTNNPNRFAYTNLWASELRRLSKIEKGHRMRGTLRREVTAVNQLVPDSYLTRAHRGKSPGLELEANAHALWVQIAGSMPAESHIRYFAELVLDRGLSYHVLPNFSTTNMLMDAERPILSGCVIGVAAYCLFHGFQPYGAGSMDEQGGDTPDIPDAFKAYFMERGHNE